MSQGEGDARSPWNEGGQTNDHWEYVGDPMNASAVDGGDGMASMMLTDDEASDLLAAANCAASMAGNPVTGTDLGAGKMHEMNGSHGNGQSA